MSISLQVVVRTLIAWRGAAVRVAAMFAFAALPPTSLAQYQRWYDLSGQAEKLNEQGNYAAALPIEQQALQVALSTWGPDERHVALSSNFLGILELNLEKFTDAETHLKQALAIDTKNEGPQGKDTATWVSCTNSKEIIRPLSRRHSKPSIFTRTYWERTTTTSQQTQTTSP